MKKTIILFLTAITLTSNVYANKEGMKVLNQIRKEIKKEEEQKRKEQEKQEKLKKEQEKKGKKVLEDIRKDMNESLEEKVFRSENTPEARIKATTEAFKVGEDRLAFIRMEEAELMEIEKELGIESNKNIYIAQKFDEVHNQYKENISEVQALLDENEKLRAYLERLDKIESRLKAGNS